MIVCADEKTSIQARQACGRTTPAHPGRPIHVPDPGLPVWPVALGALAAAVVAVALVRRDDRSGGVPA